MDKNKYQATIGLEIHAELKTASKMFCSCKNDPFHSQQNENICPVCLGMPGTLPVLNYQAIEWTIKTGMALNCQIAEFSKWDRKNYFYPDLPKGYQISQYDLPLCYKGELELSNDKKIRITRIHLEEDTGALKHPEGRQDVNYSLADYNRSGVPLMELVTDPDIETAQEAKEFCKEYQLILRHLKISNADMEKGQMRCEANISIRKLSTGNFQPSTKLGTKVEVKNLNSFKAVEKAIEYEIERQTEVLESGEKVVQETRGWDDKKGKTYIMRVKETSADYRYFPEPDLPPVILSKTYVEKLKATLPKLHSAKKEDYINNYQLSTINAALIASNPEMSEYFEEGLKDTKFIKEYASWIINEPNIMELSAKNLAELIDVIGNKEISRTAAKEIIPELKKGKSLSDIIKEKGLKQISNSGELESIVEKILKENPEIVAKIKSGKTQVIGFLVGQVMKETKGQANPQIVSGIINKKIK